VKGQSGRRFFRRRSRRIREPEGAARGVVSRALFVSKALEKRRVFRRRSASRPAFPDVDRPTFGARRGTRRAREGTRAGIERNASRLRERLTRGVGPGNARRELRVRARARCRSLSETASRSVERFRAHETAPWTPRRVQTRPKETGRGFRTMSTEVRPVCAVGACVVRARVSVVRSVREGRLVREKAQQLHSRGLPP
jgi:hypothetical protein